MSSLLRIGIIIDQASAALKQAYIVHLHLRGVHNLHVQPLVLISWLIIPSYYVLLFEPFELLKKAHLILAMCAPMRGLNVFHHDYHLLIVLIENAIAIRV